MPFLLKQMLRMISSTRNSFDHLCFWISPVLGLPNVDEYLHYKVLNNGRKRLERPVVFDYMAELFLEAKSS